MPKYSTEAQKKIEKIMTEFKHRKLRAGKDGEIVRDRDQAIAIAISEAREEDLKVPGRKK